MNARDKNTVRDSFIAAKFKAGFSPSEIQILLRQQGFRNVSRARIYQIVEQVEQAENKKST